MKPSRSRAGIFFSAVLFAAIAAVAGSRSAGAADTPPGISGNLGTAPTARSVVIERRTLPQVAPGGTVVLRGSRSSETTLAQPTIGASGLGYGSSTAPNRLIPPGAGGDVGLDASGLGRSGFEPQRP
jgi:endonuclease YncB( thermonuclease family)